MPIDRWVDKEAVVHVYNGILLSHKREHIWVSSNEVNEPRAFYTEWSKSERKNKYSILMHKYEIKKNGLWTYLQGSNRDTENRLVDTAGEEEGGTNSESSIETYISPYVKEIDWEFVI